MRFLKTNTATRISVGPFLDKTDGITPEVALTVTSEKLTFVVDDAGVPTLVLDAAPTASGGNNDMVHITNDDSGYYDLELAAANVNYVGRACLSLNDVATHLPVFHEFMILSAQAYDALCGTGNFSADAKAINAVATTSVSAVNANVGTTQPVNFTGTGATAYVKSDVVDIAGAAVNTATAQVGANVVSIANNAITANSINADAITAAKIADAAIDAATFAAGAINAAAIADGAIDAATFAAGAINAAAIADAAIDNATFAADVGTTAFATNVIAAAVFKALDSAITDAVSLTAGGLLEKVRKLSWIIGNKITVTDANGNTVVYKDDNSTAAYTVNAALTDDSTTTTRLRMA